MSENSSDYNKEFLGVCALAGGGGEGVNKWLPVVSESPVVFLVGDYCTNNIFTRHNSQNGIDNLFLMMTQSTAKNKGPTTT